MSLRISLLLCLLMSFHCVAYAKSTHKAHKTHKVRKTHQAHKPHKTLKISKTRRVKQTNVETVFVQTSKPATNLKRRKSLMHEYQSWKGTRYRFGANSHKAIDCSALTKRFYEEAFAVTLPRTTTAQIRKGKKAKYRSMRIGDLVFFKTGKVQKHVGIYIGDNQFIHASHRKGVTISELSNPYWNQHLLAVRRVLPETAIR